MINRAGLKQDAKNALRGKWGIGVLVTLIYYAVIFGADYIVRFSAGAIFAPELSLVDRASAFPTLSFVVTLLLGAPLILGITIVFLKTSRYETVAVSTTFDGFKNYGRAFRLYLIQTMFILLWSLLLIVPGIIAALRYSMSFYILADNPNMNAMDALQESKRMTDGYKMDIFVLGLSFIGWLILAMCTCGIGMLWLLPYMETTYSNLYKTLKGETTIVTEAEPSAE